MQDVIEKPKREDFYRLPSGAVVNLLDLDVALCADDTDCDDLTLAIKEKLIDLEYQLDCIEQGIHPSGEPITPLRPIDKVWLARLKKAINWSKLQVAEISMRKQAMARQRNTKRRASLEGLFVDTARLQLDKETFHKILSIAQKLSDAQEGGCAT